MDLAIGDETISEEELAELARLKVPLVRVRGQWVELDDRQLKAALKAVGRRRTGELTVGEVLRRWCDGGEEELPLVEVDADGAARRPAVRRGRPPPRADADAGGLPRHAAALPGARPVLADFLSGLGLGGILADDMGLGKTVADPVAAARRARERSPAGRRRCWSARCRWSATGRRRRPGSPRRCGVYVHHGGARQRDEELAAAVARGRPGRHHVRHRAAGPGGAARARLGRGWSATRRRRSRTAARQQAQAVRSHPGAHPARADRHAGGEPPGRALVDHGVLQPRAARPGQALPAAATRSRSNGTATTTATAALRRATGPFVLRRLKTDKTIISDLPEKMEMKVWCTSHAPSRRPSTRPWSRT